MLTRARAIAERLCTAVSGWPETEAVVLILSGEDSFDPYLFAALDVYTAGEVRDTDRRRSQFGDIVAFESSPVTMKDRFLCEEVPVRIEYKTTARFDRLIEFARVGVAGFRDTGTYAFYRIEKGELLFSRTGWLERLRSHLGRLPASFWARLADAQKAQLEHLYSDLGAAEMRGDELYFTISAGRLVGTLCALLFTVNRLFEPGGRSMAAMLPALAKVPDSLPANLESFVRQSDGMSMHQRRELAELMVKSVLSL